MKLWRHACAFLLARSETPPPAPHDWRQEVKLSCHCEDCRALQAFAADPKLQVQRFHVAKVRREHLHRQIERHGLDMTHVIERIGSPQTLVCNKTRQTHERRCRQHAQDIACLSALQSLAAAAGANETLAADCARIGAAALRVAEPAA